MAEIINDRQIFSLFEVSKSIQKTLGERYRNAYWIKAEMNKLNYYGQSGHCYPELVEKENGRVIAQIKAALWKDDFARVNSSFVDVLKEPLKDGIKILFLARISFDPAYGLSLRIIDIDPSFTLGDLEREKQETITRLEAENIFSLNKTTHLSLLPKRIAVISVETSKGYADFKHVLETGGGRTRFFLMLFPSLLQGEKMPAAMIAQLARIEKVQRHFDAVAIIRGGGGDAGLSCYNDHSLAREIARFPIPVITGIGHATNETVCEMVSFANAITPTKIAEYLLKKCNEFEGTVQRAAEMLAEKPLRIIATEKEKLRTVTKMTGAIAKNMLDREQYKIAQQKNNLVQQYKFFAAAKGQQLRTIEEQFSAAPSRFIKMQVQELDSLQKNVQLLDPKLVLRRGFSITYRNGTTVKNAGEIKPGDVLQTTFYEGEITSTAN